MPSKPTRTFRQRVLQSGSWNLAGYGVIQALRLGGNLILTRLLFPEAFGLMAIINAVLFGLHMLSDIGIGPSIVQKSHGNNPVFLNTAWAIQIVRGCLVWIVLCVLALPLAGIYDEPLLASMVPVVGLTAVISGFNSTNLYAAQRNLEIKRVTLIEINTSAFGLFCMIYLAWILQSVWALVLGSLITAGMKMLASHILLPDIRNRLAWDHESLKHLTGFGRWIILNSGLTFLSVEGARLIIGAVLDMRQLALFTLANTMNLMIWQAMYQLAWKIFFPAYSEVFRDNPKNIGPVLLKSRLVLILPSWVLAALFIFFGSQLMEFLYDERYHGSGAMLELLAAGSLITCVWGSYAGVLLALGKAGTMTNLTAIQVACQFSALWFGYRYGGSTGLIMGVAAANWVVYPVYAFVMFRNGLWQPRIDLIFLAASILIVALHWFGIVHT